MTDEQMIGLLSYYHDSICADVEALSSRSVSEHLAWMCSESIRFVQKGPDLHGPRAACARHARDRHPARHRPRL